VNFEKHAIENAIATASGKATYAGAGTTVTGWIFSSEFAVAFGLLVGAAGFLVNTYYRWKQDRREQLEHEIRVAAAIEATPLSEQDLP
jgi:dihydrodipicolinate synthase/N-acetylneuraminate lyase